MYRDLPKSIQAEVFDLLLRNQFKEAAKIFDDYQSLSDK
jgi:hypothetical protein